MKAGRRLPPGSVPLVPGMTFEPLPVRVEVHELRPGDRLVLRVPGVVTQETADRLRAQIEARFPGHVAVVLGDGMTLDVVRPADQPESPPPPRP